ncbi:MAG: hypothetical protein H7836_04295 [Magnetococcus sp. YQC-3]
MWAYFIANNKVLNGEVLSVKSYKVRFHKAKRFSAIFILTIFNFLVIVHKLKEQKMTNENENEEKPIVYEVAIEGKILENIISQIGQIFKLNKLTTIQGLAVTKTLEGRIIEMLKKEHQHDLNQKECAPWLN